ncbi:4Fe-4S binding protein, partial [bacterium]|nr:4Fe-4S binding protein [bacterium]
MKAKHLVWARRISQTFFLLLFLFLLIESRLPQDIFVDYSQAFSAEQDLALHQPIKFFFELSPLVGLSSLVSGYRIINGFLWGAGVLVLTVLLGRVFCGFVCPFGTIHHLVSWVKPSLKGERMVKANQK